MNVQLSPAQVAEIASVNTMSKRDKLLRFAQVIRSGSRVPLFVFSNLEYMDSFRWEYCQHPASAFSLAAKDPILKDAGLGSDTVGAAQRFFELSRDELHAFSCDCGGQISHEEMARRIDRLAASA
jgi:hypothetical protein